jgi:hypothetical protein
MTYYFLYERQFLRKLNLMLKYMPRMAYVDPIRKEKLVSNV